MKHLFIVNRFSGQGNSIDAFIKEIKDVLKDEDFEIHETEGKREAVAFLKKYLKNYKNKIRVYACGGDGTVNEVVNGIVGHKNVELAVYPIGTGNDFVKTYSKSRKYDDIVFNKTGDKRFLDLKKLVNSKSSPIDLSKISSSSLNESWYSINIVNFGFDAIVGAMGNFYKENGIPDDAKKDEKDDPYKYALNHDAMKHGRFNNIVVYADGEKLNQKKLLLGTVAQGQFVGNTFWCSPKSSNTDGLLDVCIIKTMNLLSLGLLYIKPYTKGKHLFRKMRKIVYRRCKNVKVVAPKEIDICIDGEMIKGKEIIIECVHNAINLVIPD